MAPVSFSHVSKRFGDEIVVEDFTLDVTDGEFLVLVGGSGSGKSTILRMAAGLETVTTGTIHIGERDVTSVPARARDVAMVFQDYALYPHMTVRENLSLGLRLRNMPRREVERRVQWSAELLGLEQVLDRRPKQLSGGQRQRVAMGRAMVREPRLFLFDEPLSNLDAGLRAQMRIEIGSLQRRLNTTTLYVTHDQAEAMTLGNRIVVLAKGRVQQIGRPMDVYHAPVNRFVAGFIGSPSMNFITGVVKEEEGTFVFVTDGVRLKLHPRSAAAANPVEPVTLGIRPEDMAIEEPTDMSATRANNVLCGQLVLIERLGGTSHAHVDVGPHRIIASIASGPAAEVGANVTVRVPADRIHLFSADGRALR